VVRRGGASGGWGRVANFQKKMKRASGGGCPLLLSRGGGRSSLGGGFWRGAGLGSLSGGDPGRCVVGGVGGGCRENYRALKSDWGRGGGEGVGQADSVLEGEGQGLGYLK